MQAKHPEISGGYARFVITLACTALLALPGCREDRDETIPAAARPTAEAPPEARDWLEVGDPRAPLAFMADATRLPPGELSPGLVALEHHYRESPRMIANRVIQLWEQPPGALPPVPRLMADLLPRADGPPRSLGPVIQHYRVLRENGLDHDRAIAGAVNGDGQ